MNDQGHCFSSSTNNANSRDDDSDSELVRLPAVVGVGVRSRHIADAQSLEDSLHRASSRRLHHSQSPPHACAAVPDEINIPCYHCSNNKIAATPPQRGRLKRMKFIPLRALVTSLSPKKMASQQDDSSSNHSGSEEESNVDSENVDQDEPEETSEEASATGSVTTPRAKAPQQTGKSEELLPSLTWAGESGTTATTAATTEASFSASNVTTNKDHASLETEQVDGGTTTTPAAIRRLFSPVRKDGYIYVRRLRELPPPGLEEP